MSVIGQPQTSSTLFRGANQNQVLSAISHLPGVVHAEVNKNSDVIDVRSTTDHTQAILSDLLRPAIGLSPVHIRPATILHVTHPPTAKEFQEDLSAFPGVTKVFMAPLPLNPTADPVFTVVVDSADSKALMQAMVKDQLDVRDSDKPWDIRYSVAQPSE